MLRRILGICLLFNLAFAGGPMELIPPVTTSWKSDNSHSRVIMADAEHTIIAWESSRANLGYKNIYIQKIDRDGKYIFPVDGLPVAPFPAGQSNFSMIPDGYGGAILVWEDARTAQNNPVICAQRINVRGEPLWGNTGKIISSPGKKATRPEVISDKKNGFYIVWESNLIGNDNSNLFAQHLDLGGVIHWENGGKALSDAGGIQQNFDITADEEGNLLTIWEDFRNQRYWNLYVQKTKKDGSNLWGQDGLDLFAGVEENQHQPQIVSDGNGGMIFVYQKWSDQSRGYDIYRGRINPYGELLYHYSTCHSIHDQVNPRLIRRNTDLLIVWEDSRNEDQDLYGQLVRMNDGLILWDVNGVPVVKSYGRQEKPVLVYSPPHNTQYVLWEDHGDIRPFVRAQKLSASGEALWGSGGIRICRTDGAQTQPAAAITDDGGFWVTWTDARKNNLTPIYAQHINIRGEADFQADGLRMAAEQDGPFAKLDELTIIAGNQGDFFLSWTDYRNGSNNPDIYLQKTDATGKLIWRSGGIPVCDEPGKQTRPVLVPDAVGGVFVIWTDRRNNTDENIYAQRINASGKRLWNAAGVPVCTALRTQGQVRAISDGEEGLILAWTDSRNFDESGFDLYMQKLDHGGKALWGDNGKPFARYSGIQTSPDMAADGKGGVYIAWMDNRNGPMNVYLQHLDHFGMLQWTYGGIPVQQRNSNQRNPKIIRNFIGDIIVAWEDDRFGDDLDKIYLQRITPNQTFLWGHEGIMLSNSTGKQSNVKMHTDDSGNIWLTWTDGRLLELFGFSLYAQKLDTEGKKAWDSHGVEIGRQMKTWNWYDVKVNSKGYSWFGWNEMAPGASAHAYIQKLRPDGLKKLNMDGIMVGAFDGIHIYPAMDMNHDGNVLLGWIHFNESEQMYRIDGVLSPSLEQ